MLKTVSFVIRDLNQVELSGNTVLFLSDGSAVYRLDLSEENAAKAAFLKTGDSISCSYSEEESGVRNIMSLE